MSVDPSNSANPDGVWIEMNKMGEPELTARTKEELANLTARGLEAVDAPDAARSLEEIDLTLTEVALETLSISGGVPAKPLDPNKISVSDPEAAIDDYTSSLKEKLTEAGNEIDTDKQTAGSRKQEMDEGGIRWGKLGLKALETLFLTAITGGTYLLWCTTLLVVQGRQALSYEEPVDGVVRQQGSEALAHKIGQLTEQRTKIETLLQMNDIDPKTGKSDFAEFLKENKFDIKKFSPEDCIEAHHLYTSSAAANRKALKRQEKALEEEQSKLPQDTIDLKGEIASEFVKRLEKYSAISKETALNYERTKIQGEIQDLMGSMRKIQMESNAIPAKIESLEVQIEELTDEQQEEKDELQQQVDALNDNLKQLPEIITQLTEKKNSLEQNLEVLNRPEAPAAAGEEEPPLLLNRSALVHSLDRKIQEKQNEITELAQEIELNETPIKKVEKELEATNKKITSLKKDLDTLDQSDQAKVQITIGQLGKEVKDLETNLETYKDIREDIAELKTSHADLKKEIESLNKEKSDLENNPSWNAESQVVQDIQKEMGAVTISIAETQRKLDHPKIQDLQVTQLETTLVNLKKTRYALGLELSLAEKYQDMKNVIKTGEAALNNAIANLEAFKKKCDPGKLGELMTLLQATPDLQLGDFHPLLPIYDKLKLEQGKVKDLKDKLEALKAKDNLPDIIKDTIHHKEVQFDRRKTKIKEEQLALGEQFAPNLRSNKLPKLQEPAPIESEEELQPEETD